MPPFLKNKKILIGLGIFGAVLFITYYFLFVPHPSAKKLPEKTASLKVARTDRVDIEIKDVLIHLNPYALPEETTVVITKQDISEGPKETEYPELKTLAVVDIEPSVPSLFINPDDPGVDPGYIAFKYPCGQLSQEEQDNLSIASFENGEWVLLRSWCNGDNVLADLYHLSKFSLVSLVKDFGNQLLEKFKEEFIPVEKIPSKFLYSKLKSIVFLGCKQITFPLAVLERLFIPANYQDPPSSAFNKIFVYFYDLGFTEGYQAAKTAGTKPTTGDWITDDMIPKKTGKEIMQKIDTEPSMYVDESKEFEGKTFTESRPVSSYFVDQEPAIEYAQNAYRLGYGFGFEQGVYDNNTGQNHQAETLSSYIKNANQLAIEFSAQESIAKIIANPSVAKKEELPPALSETESKRAEDEGESLPSQDETGIVVGDALITKDISQFVLNSPDVDEAGYPFEIIKQDYVIQFPEWFGGAEQGYIRRLKSYELGAPTIYNEAFKFSSIELTKTAFESAMQGSALRELVYRVAGIADTEVVSTGSVVGDDSLNLRVIQSGISDSEGYLSIFRKRNIIEILFLNAAQDGPFKGKELTLPVFFSHARILEGRIK